MIFGVPRLFLMSPARWFVYFIDDCTCALWIFMLKHKTDISTILPNFCSIIKNHLGSTSRDLGNIISGIEERENGHLLEET